MSDAIDSTDSLYPMRVVTRQTGLSSHVIRVWERRYDAVVPTRTGGNSRRYSAADIRKLTLLKRATAMGYRIKDLAPMTEPDLERLVAREERTTTAAADPGTSPNEMGHLHREYLDAISRFQVRRASRTLSRAAALLNPVDLVYQVILPLLRTTGDLWHSGEFTVAHEHAVSNQMRGLLDTLLRLATPQPGAPRLVVATPAGHLHEFGVLVGAQLAAARGVEPIYLGANVPDEDLVSTLTISRAPMVLLGVLVDMDAGQRRRLRGLITRLQQHAEVWVGLPDGHPAHGDVDAVRYFDRFEDLDIALTQMGSARANT